MLSQKLSKMKLSLLPWHSKTSTNLSAYWMWNLSCTLFDSIKRPIFTHWRTTFGLNRVKNVPVLKCDNLAYLDSIRMYLDWSSDKQYVAQMYLDIKIYTKCILLFLWYKTERMYFHGRAAYIILISVSYIHNCISYTNEKEFWYGKESLDVT